MGPQQQRRQEASLAGPWPRGVCSCWTASPPPANREHRGCVQCVLRGVPGVRTYSHSAAAAKGRRGRAKRGGGLQGFLPQHPRPALQGAVRAAPWKVLGLGGETLACKLPPRGIGLATILGQKLRFSGRPFWVHSSTPPPAPFPKHPRGRPLPQTSEWGGGQGAGSGRLPWQLEGLKGGARVPGSVGASDARSGEGRGGELGGSTGGLLTAGPGGPAGPSLPFSPAPPWGGREGRRRLGQASEPRRGRCRRGGGPTPRGPRNPQGDLLPASHSTASTVCGAGGNISSSPKMNAPVAGGAQVCRGHHSPRSSSGLGPPGAGPVHPPPPQGPVQGSCHPLKDTYPSARQSALAREPSQSCWAVLARASGGARVALKHTGEPGCRHKPHPPRRGPETTLGAPGPGQAWHRLTSDLHLGQEELSWSGEGHGGSMGLPPSQGGCSEGGVGWEPGPPR